MILVDTHVLLFDALSPTRLSAKARKLLNSDGIACSAISLWEIAMLVSKKRIELPVELGNFLDDVLQARSVRVLPITAQTAVLSTDKRLRHGDPADRLIAATSWEHDLMLLTHDQKLAKVEGLRATR